MDEFEMPVCRHILGCMCHYPVQYAEFTSFTLSFWPSCGYIWPGMGCYIGFFYILSVLCIMSGSFVICRSRRAATPRHGLAWLSTWRHHFFLHLPAVPSLPVCRPQHSTALPYGPCPKSAPIFRSARQWQPAIEIWLGRRHGSFSFVIRQRRVCFGCITIPMPPVSSIDLIVFPFLWWLEARHYT